MELLSDIHRANGLIIRTDASELTAMDLNPNWEFTISPIISINWLLWLANHLIRKEIFNMEQFWNCFYNYRILLGTFCLDFRLYLLLAIYVVFKNLVLLWIHHRLYFYFLLIFKTCKMRRIDKGLIFAQLSILSVLQSKVLLSAPSLPLKSQSKTALESHKCSSWVQSKDLVLLHTAVKLPPTFLTRIALTVMRKEELSIPVKDNRW